MPSLLLLSVCWLNCNGVFLFRPCDRHVEVHSQVETFVVSSLLFQIGLLVLLEKTLLIAPAMKQFCLSLAKIFVDIFILEFALCCYWYPLEILIHNMPSAWEHKLGNEYGCDVFELCSLTEGFICSFKDPLIANIVCTVLGALFLIFAMQVTRKPDANYEIPITDNTCDTIKPRKGILKNPREPNYLHSDLNQM